MQTPTETAYRVAMGKCIDAMYSLQRYQSDEALTCLREAIITIENERRRAQRQAHLDRSRAIAAASVPVPVAFGDPF